MPRVLDDAGGDVGMGEEREHAEVIATPRAAGDVFYLARRFTPEHATLRIRLDEAEPRLERVVRRMGLERS